MRSFDYDFERRETGASVQAVGMDGRTRAIAAIPGGDVLDIAPDGAALLSVGAYSGELRLSTSDSDREITSLTGAFGEVSADGRTVVYSANGGIFMQAVAGGAPVHLADGTDSHLSPDGRTVLVYRAVQSQRSLVPVGPGEEKPVRFPGIADHDIGAVHFTDSKHILFSVAPNRRPEALYLGDPRGEANSGRRRSTLRCFPFPGRHAVLRAAVRQSLVRLHARRKAPSDCRHRSRRVPARLDAGFPRFLALQRPRLRDLPFECQ